jgi:hypothetical protein
VNTSWSDELQALDQVGPSRDLWAEALARAASSHLYHGATPGRFHALARMRSWRRRTAVTVSVAVLAALGAGSALAYHYLGPSPGFTAGLSGLDSLPTVPWPSSIPKEGLPQLASATGLTATQAEQRMRLVQSGLSLGNQSVDLYAFPGDDGSACVFLTGSGGICLPTWMRNNPALDGVAWAAWGGDGPMAPTGPLGVFGLVADNVSGVEADISGTMRSVPIVSNSFYANYDQITNKDTIKLIVRFDDGTTRTFSAPNPYADNGPTQLKHLSPPTSTTP